LKRLILALVLCHPLHWAILAGAGWVTVAMAMVIPLAMLDGADLPKPKHHYHAWPKVHPVDAWMEMDADLLADVALGEDSEALAAVMWVVLNRRKPGEALEATIQNGQAFGSMRGGRFRPSWHRVPGRRWARFYPGHWAQAQETAWDVLLGLSDDPTGGADHFHRAGTWRPSWAPPRGFWTLVGSHHFYRATA